MKIDEMVDREDFYVINEKSLQAYFDIVYGHKLEIRTLKNFLTRNVCIYPKINAIITRFPSRRVINYVLSEFNIRDGKIKYVAAKIYCLTCLFSAGLFADKTLQFNGLNPIHDDILIWPSNRKLRIFDFRNKYIDSIIKTGFTSKYFKNELTFRLSSEYKFIPGIISYGENWYREPILSGQPLARITDKKLYVKSRNEAIAHMREIAEQSVRYVKSKEYALELWSKVKQLIHQAKSHKKIQTSENILKVASVAFNKAISLKEDIPLVISHGDLQAGNIWVDNRGNRTYIIDWETHEFRSIWYDPATLLLETRKKNGLHNLVNIKEPDRVKNAILANDVKKDYNIDSILGIIVLEDIIFCLEDNLELPNDWGGELIDLYGGHLMRLDWK